MSYDICIVGSGAGAGPIIYELSKAGYKVLVLEKGPWFKTEDWTKDEMTATRRDAYRPNLAEECHVVERPKANGQWSVESTYESGKDMWNGSAVGGSSNFMSAYFHRLKPKDFRLLSEYGPIEGANVVDWPISYDELEPYYAKVEQVVGVSGKVVPHKHQEPRSTPDFPYPPLTTNIVADWFIEAGKQAGFTVIPAPRGIISQPKDHRKGCYHSNYCGSFGCSSDAKGSSRAALLPDALATGNCEVRANCKVFKLDTNAQNEVSAVHFYNEQNEKESVSAKLFVVACQAVETSRLLLMSKTDQFPDGLANNSGQVGKNLLFAGGGSGSGSIKFENLSEEDRKKFDIPLTFVNQALQDFYEIDDEEFGGKAKGGTIDFLIEHSNPMPKAYRNRYKQGTLQYGSELKKSLFEYFTKQRRVRFEVFCDWLPNDDCHVTLDDEVVDKWGDPVGKVKIGFHQQDVKVGNYLAEKAKIVLQNVGAESISIGIGGNPPTNLMAGGCRFGNDPQTSVLDKNCKAHEVDNLYVTDGSFMPTGGSVPHTLTIYANSFRVADKIIARLDRMT
ncbi:MAG: GMC family oxidoreductase [Flavobacteriales bacterium]|nr:GMC family oxidoreductase [Flavobacteriales bacterium]